MTRKNVKAVTVSVVLLTSVVCGWNSYSHCNGVKVSDCVLSENVEAISACESVGWWNNDGNCVNNGRGAYFCKKDDWLSITDCKI